MTRREDTGTRTEADAAAFEHAHRPDPERINPSDLDHTPDAPFDPVNAAELRAALIELQARWTG